MQWRLVRSELGKVRQHVQLSRSATDHRVEPVNSRIVLEGVGSADVTEIVLADGFHRATLDHDALSLVTGNVECTHRIHQERAKEIP